MMKGVAMRKRRDDEHGAAALEFGLLFIPFMLLIFGIIQYGYYFWTAETTSSAAREVARRIVVGDCWDSYEDLASDHAPAMTSADVAPDPAGAAVGDPIVVTIVSDAKLLGLFPLPDDGEVTRTYDARMEVDEATDSPSACGG